MEIKDELAHQEFEHSSEENDREVFNAAENDSLERNKRKLHLVTGTIEKSRRTLESSVQEINDLLKTMNPTHFSLGTIKTFAPNAYFFITRRIANGYTSWEEITRMLDPDLADRFSVERKYRTIETAIHEIELIIRENNLKELSPYDIQTYDNGLYQFLIKNLRTEDEEINWDFLRNSINPDLGCRFVLKYENRTRESVIQEINECIRILQPAEIYPEFIIKNVGDDAYTFIRKNIRTADGKKVDWDYIANRLPDEYGDKFKLKREEQTFESSIQQINDLLENNDPEKFSPKYIQLHLPKIYYYFFTHVRDQYGEIDWSLMVKSLPKKFGSRFEQSEQSLKERFISILNRIIEQSKLEKVNPNYIKKNYKWVYGQLQKLFSDRNGNTDWQYISERLNPLAKEKFGFNRTKKSALIELNELLKSKKPEKINARYIKQLDGSLFEFLRINFVDKKGHIDWKLIVRNLNNEFRQKFVYPVRYDRSLPEGEYEDTNEIDRKLGDKKEKLYTFFQTNGEEDKEKRNEICLELIKLAKKGNKAAEDKLMDLMYFLAGKWSEQIPAFKVFQYHQEAQHEIIRRCIYNYRIKGPFVGYVHESLKRAAQGLPPVYESEFQDTRKYQGAIY